MNRFTVASSASNATYMMEGHAQLVDKLQFIRLKTNEIPHNYQIDSIRVESSDVGDG